MASSNKRNEGGFDSFRRMIKHQEMLAEQIGLSLRKAVRQEFLWLIKRARRSRKDKYMRY